MSVKPLRATRDDMLHICLSRSLIPHSAPLIPHF